MGRPHREHRTYSLLQIPVAARQRRESVERFTALGTFERASDENEMIRAWLLCPVADHGEVAVLAEWPSAEA
jgi:hypothetical protein